MQHDLAAQGYGCRIRPISTEDAPFVVVLRSDRERSKYLHPISLDARDEERWLRAYLNRAGDYYFVVERLRDRRSEGTIGLYDLDERAGSAECGRWILRRGSFCAAASALLIYRVAFEALDLVRVRTRTVAENAAVVSFHDACGLARVAVLPGHFELDGQRVDAIEHVLAIERWPAVSQFLVDRATAASKLLER